MTIKLVHIGAGEYEEWKETKLLVKSKEVDSTTQFKNKGKIFKLAIRLSDAMDTNLNIVNKIIK